ncbi:aminoglycoside phosphotransferase family protein [Paenibacillus sp. P25]|nr:aminoglycoside phosphotransferase family protein [Paenibacillus sp. P25]
MNSFKPEMHLETALEILQKIESESVSHVTPIEMGELSKVFSYRKDGQELVIHFKKSKETLEKTKWISDRYSLQLPIPKVVKVGTIGDIHYSITEKVKGAPVSTLNADGIRQLIPDLIKRFSMLAQIPCDDSGSFGWISPLGEASFDSWSECLASFFEEEQEGFYHGWPLLFEQSFLERDVFEKFYSIMIDLAQYAPKERYLVHGDFHFGNMLSDGHQITGIVDWEMAMYGDFMFDACRAAPVGSSNQFSRTAPQSLGRNGPDHSSF